MGQQLARTEWARQQAVQLYHRLGDVDELAAGVSRVVAQQLERALVVELVALHEDAFGPLDHGAPAERTLEALELGEAAQHGCPAPLVNPLVVRLGR